MTWMCRSGWFVAAGLCMAVASGCQTYNPESGNTLPSPHYLGHIPQYFPQSPSYPLPKETKSLEDAAKQNEDNQRAGGF